MKITQEKIEKILGRKKTAKNAPRKCDIDILDYSSKRMSKNVILPQAIPGMMSGIILALSRAIGEAAPILMISSLVWVTFVPTTPNPTSGFLLMVPKKEIIYLDVSFEQASKFIVSAGTTNIN